MIARHPRRPPNDLIRINRAGLAERDDDRACEADRAMIRAGVQRRQITTCLLGPDNLRCIGGLGFGDLVADRLALLRRQAGGRQLLLIGGDRILQLQPTNQHLPWRLECDGLVADFVWARGERREQTSGERVISAGRYAIAREAEAKERQGSRTA